LGDRYDNLLALIIANSILALVATVIFLSCVFSKMWHKKTEYAAFIIWIGTIMGYLLMTTQTLTLLYCGSSESTVNISASLGIFMSAITYGAFGRWIVGIIEEK